jgi:hypothetical protein
VALEVDEIAEQADLAFRRRIEDVGLVHDHFVQIAVRQLRDAVDMELRHRCGERRADLIFVGSGVDSRAKHSQRKG